MALAQSVASPASLQNIEPEAGATVTSVELDAGANPLWTTPGLRPAGQLGLQYVGKWANTASSLGAAGQC